MPRGSAARRRGSGTASSATRRGGQAARRGRRSPPGCSRGRHRGPPRPGLAQGDQGVIDRLAAEPPGGVEGRQVILDSPARDLAQLQVAEGRHEPLAEVDLVVVESRRLDQGPLARAKCRLPRRSSGVRSSPRSTPARAVVSARLGLLPRPPRGALHLGAVASPVLQVPGPRAVLVAPGVEASAHHQRDPLEPSAPSSRRSWRWQEEQLAAGSGVKRQRIAALACPVHCLVCSLDEVFEGIVCLEFREPNGD